MLIHPNEHSRQVRQGMVNDLGTEPFHEYFNRTGPLVDIYETADEIIVSCEVPGLQKKDDVNISVAGKTVTINGIIQRASEDTNDNRYYRTERFYGNFYRVIHLPDKVIEDSARASYRNGVLEIRMTKGSRGNQIDIDFQ